MATTSNPVLARATFAPTGEVGTMPMTLGGTIAKTLVLLGILTVTATFSWLQAGAGLAEPDKLGTLFLVGIVGGFGVALYTVFRPQHAPVTAPIYAALEGLLLGALSAILNLRYKGLPVQAVVLTVATLGVMLVSYRLGIIRATERFKTIVISCTFAVAAFYIIALVMAMLGLYIPFLHEGGPIGIGFSLFVTGLAAFNLILDFDLIEQGVGRAPGYMEWYAAFGLVVTLVWLYLEILRLLRKLRR
ncbi:MAG TPA: Bax inhibitor-1/YccA family protein [Gemmatimonadales bacterium]|jgi:uncharacterized YccA/Bax inhibitor family protein|nr:Bax inhibitor-1/YccA family protein [Gemmatimonadales bacterium]